jgi:hypothetical protein
MYFGSEQGEETGLMSRSVTYEGISTEESWAVFNDAARRLLGMDGQTVIEKWDSGALADSKTPELMRVLMLRPSGR